VTRSATRSPQARTRSPGAVPRVSTSIRLRAADHVDYLKCVPLSTDVAAFVQEHRRWGLLDGGVEGGWVRVSCECGAQLVRRADED